MTTSKRVLLLFLLLSGSSCLHQNIILLAQSYVIDGSSSSANSILSRFQNVQCQLFMTVDRTAPPPSTLSSAANDINFTPIATGSKLGLPLDIQFTSNPVDEEMNNESLLLGTTPPPPIPSTSSSSSSFLSVEPITTPKYVTLTGQKSVHINPGAYACELSHPSTKQYFFRFFLDFPTVVTRNDATIPAERIYFMSSCWKSEDNMIHKARQWKEVILTSLTKLTTQIEQMENNHTVGLVARTTSFPKYIELLKQRKQMRQQLEMLEDGFPLDRPLIDGPNDTVFLKEGVIAVKRVYGGGSGRGKIQTRYHWIGTFSFKDFVYNAEGGEE
jgi:hypothetical protein